MVEAKVLGQLFLMQSVINNLPDKDSVISFVLRGLSELPGVKKIDFIESFSKSNETFLHILSLKNHG